jgi:hypothetical protein
MEEKEILKRILAATEDTQQRQQRMETALFGDEKAKIEGALSKVSKHERELRKAKMVGVFAGGAVIGWPAAWEAIKGWFSK